MYQARMVTEDPSHSEVVRIGIQLMSSVVSAKFTQENGVAHIWTTILTEKVCPLRNSRITGVRT